jgi:signal transduction histidine kinase
LAIVAEIATAHGGIVTIGEHPGGGALVTVQLPLTKLPDSKR